jgi:hypothetical protein
LSLIGLLVRATSRLRSYLIPGLRRTTSFKLLPQDANNVNSTNNMNMITVSVKADTPVMACCKLFLPPRKVRVACEAGLGTTAWTSRLSLHLISGQASTAQIGVKTQVVVRISILQLRIDRNRAGHCSNAILRALTKIKT